MDEALTQVFEQAFEGKHFLSAIEIAEFLNCSPKVIYNWMKRSDPNRRPPRFRFGQETRFPKKEFVKWLVEEQGRDK